MGGRTGGAAIIAGQPAAGGLPQSGGMVTGGVPMTGGRPQSGGNPQHGGTPPNGGHPQNGGQVAGGAIAPVERCGDGVRQGQEACDDGNPEDTDECTTECEEPRCGDGYTQAVRGEVR